MDQAQLKQTIGELEGLLAELKVATAADAKRGWAERLRGLWWAIVRWLARRGRR
jgi:hypothetical protein